MVTLRSSRRPVARQSHNNVLPAGITRALSHFLFLILYILISFHSSLTQLSSPSLSHLQFSLPLTHLSLLISSPSPSPTTPSPFTPLSLTSSPSTSTPLPAHKHTLCWTRKVHKQWPQMWHYMYVGTMHRLGVGYAKLVKQQCVGIARLQELWIIYYRILRIIRPWCIIRPPPSSAKSYVKGYLYIVSAHPLLRDCSLYWKRWQQASDKFVTCRWLWE